MPMIVGYGRPSAVISGSVSAALRRGLVGLEARGPARTACRARRRPRAARGVGGPARDGQPERDRAGMGDDDVEVGRLGDDREVAGGAGPDRGERPLPAVLLGRHEGDDELAVRALEVAGSARAPGPPRGSPRRRPSCRRRRGRTARPSRISPPHGSAVHVAGSPGGTTSRCPDSTIRRPPGRPTRPITTGSDVRGISSPGPGRIVADGDEIGPDRLYAGARAGAMPHRPRRRTASSEPVMLGMRINSRRSSSRRSRSITAPAPVGQPVARVQARRIGPGHARRARQNR